MIVNLGKESSRNSMILLPSVVISGMLIIASIDTSCNGGVTIVNASLWVFIGRKAYVWAIHA